MFERLNTATDAFNWQLGAALTMEREILGMLDELIDESQQESLKLTFRSHQAETRNHVSNLEQAFRALGWDVDDSPCPTIKAIEKEGKANIKKSDDAIVDGVILEGAMETEHHEIAVYEHLIIQARALGHGEVVDLLSQNLRDEQQALEKVRGLAEQVAAEAPARVA